MSLVARRANATVVAFNGFQRGVFKAAHTFLYVALKQLTEDEQESSRSFAAYEALGDLMSDLPEVVEVENED